MRPQELFKKKTYICRFQTNYPYDEGFYASFLGFQTNWAGNLLFRKLILVGGHISYFRLLAKSGCQNHKLAGSTFPPIQSFWRRGWREAWNIGRRKGIRDTWMANREAIPHSCDAILGVDVQESFTSKSTTKCECNLVDIFTGTFLLESFTRITL